MAMLPAVATGFRQVAPQLIGTLLNQVAQNPARVAEALGFSKAQKSTLVSARKDQRRKIAQGYIKQLGQASYSLPTKPGKERVKAAQQFQSNPTNRRQIAPSGHGYYDAFVHEPNTAVTAISIGIATPVKGLARFASPSVSRSITAGKLNTRLLVVNGASSSDAVAQFFYMLHHSAFTCDPPVRVNAFNGMRSDGLLHATTMTPHIDTLPGDPDAWPPMEQRVSNIPGSGIESIPVRGSLRIRNVSETMKCGGSVRVLRFTGGLPISTDHNDAIPNSDGVVGTAAEFEAICDMIRNSPHTTTYSGSELINMHQINQYVVDQTRCTSFSSKRTFRDGMTYPAMTNLLVLIEDFSPAGDNEGNVYEFTFCCQRLARFDVGTLLHSNATSIKNDISKVNAARNHEESFGSRLLKVAQHPIKSYQSGFRALENRVASFF